jgi:hypothetical protein
LKLKCDELLSSFAFNFNLRRYTKEAAADQAAAEAKAGRCWLKLVETSVESTWFSALEAVI